MENFAHQHEVGEAWRAPGKERAPFSGQIPVQAVANCPRRRRDVAQLILPNLRSSLNLPLDLLLGTAINSFSIARGFQPYQEVLRR